MKKLIFNADDFGYGFGINKGIIKAHTEGVVTSTSVMVFRLAAYEARELLNYPRLSVGLHFDITDEGIKADFMRKIPLSSTKIKKIGEQFYQQIEKFVEIVGKEPDHLDAHHHVHFHLRIKPLFEEYSQKHNVPVRGFNDFNFIDSFFGWNRLKRTDLKSISVDSLFKILSNLKDGVNEIMCHPGLIDEGLRKISRYLEEREKEVETLTNKRVIDFIRESGIELCSWKAI